jgi:hypothetical protein
VYGKVFEDLFCSTLMDCGGDTAYVFIAMIVLSDEQGYLKHTDNSLARMICKPVEAVREAIKNLEKPDKDSNIKAHEGRRIIPLHELMNDETRGWLVVNKEIYRDRASKEDKRKADRDRIAEKRKEIKDVADSRKPSRSVADVAYTDTDTDTDKNKPKSPADAGPIWTECLSVLRDQRFSEASARAFLGMLCRDYEEPVIVGAVKAAIGKADAKGYILGVLKDKPKKGQAPRFPI